MAASLPPNPKRAGPTIPPAWEVLLYTPAAAEEYTNAQAASDAGAPPVTLRMLMPELRRRLGGVPVVVAWRFEGSVFCLPSVCAQRALCEHLLFDHPCSKSPKRETSSASSDAFFVKAALSIDENYLKKY